MGIYVGVQGVLARSYCEGECKVNTTDIMRARDLSLHWTGVLYEVTVRQILGMRILLSQIFQNIGGVSANLPRMSFRDEFFGCCSCLIPQAATIIPRQGLHCGQSLDAEQGGAGPSAPRPLLEQGTPTTLLFPFSLSRSPARFCGWIPVKTTFLPQLRLYPSPTR